MPVNLMPLLLRGLHRPEYEHWREHHVGETSVSFDAGALRILLGIVAARFAFNALLRGPTARLAQARGTTPHHRDGSRLLEECWVLVGNLAMLAGAMYVVLRRNGGCWFLDTRTCLAGWPDHPLDPAVKLYYDAETAWYLHMLLKPALRYGLPDGRDMLVHHFASLALILISYGANLTRIGAVVLSVFAMSNPLLHVAKICNQLSLGPMKIGGFVLFAAVFFVSRVLLVPWAVLKPAMWDSWSVIPHVVADFPKIFYGINALLALLYCLQLLWMRGIVRVLRSAASHGAEAASNMSAKIDPAKRYAAHAEAPDGLAATAAGGGKGGAARQRTGGALPKTPSPADPPVLRMADGPKLE